MSGLIRSSTTGWGGFFLTALVYMVIQGLTDFSIWLADVGKEGFATVSLYDWLVFGAKVGASMLIVLRALMNGSYGEAKRQQPTEANEGNKV